MLGNLTYKSDVGTYTYPAAGQPQPHGVTSINGTLVTSFTYDPDGNQTAGAGRTIGFSSFNKPTSITQGTKTLSFEHDTEHQRFLLLAPEGTTIYLSDPMGSGLWVEKFTGAGGASQWNEYLFAGGAMIGERFEYGSGTVATRYFNTDHLGSVSVITDENANVVERDSYDAWGKRRFPNGQDDPTDSITSQSTRGSSRYGTAARDWRRRRRAGV